MKLDHIRSKIDEAIQIREDGDLKESRKLFNSVLSEITPLLSEKPSKKLMKLYVYAQSAYIIQIRLEAKKASNEALELGKKIYEFDKLNDLNEPESIRSVSNSMLDLGLFEQAIPYLEELVELYKDNSGRKGDALAHLSACQFRVGRSNKALKNVNKAIKEIGINTAQENKRFTAVWMTHAMMVKALIVSSLGKNKKAVSLAKDAKKLASKNDAVFREEQADVLLKYLEGRNVKASKRLEKEGGSLRTQ